MCYEWLLFEFSLTNVNNVLLIMLDLIKSKIGKT